MTNNNRLPDDYFDVGGCGILVRHLDGSLYGVLCGFIFEPLPAFSEKDVVWLEVAARAASRSPAKAHGRKA